MLTRFYLRRVGEVGKLLGAKWKELDDSEKKPYVEQAAQDKQRAEQQKAEYDVRPLSFIPSSLILHPASLFNLL